MKKLRIQNPKLTQRGFTLVDPGFPDRSPRQALSGVTSLHKGFTLVELMIVVAILGILAAIVIPEFQGHIQQAKESAAKDNLRILREAIERYAMDHNGIPPGYPLDNSNGTPLAGTVKIHLVGGNYLSELPENPFNGMSGISVLNNATTFPDAPSNTDTYGWIYQPSTKTIKLNWAGTDAEGTPYFNY